VLALKKYVLVNSSNFVRKWCISQLWR